MVLNLVRHGETDWNAGDLVQGWTESDLNEHGRRQAQLLARRFATIEERPTLIYSSPLRRARQTAQPTADALGLEIRCLDDLREMRCGSWEGLNFSEIRETRKDEFLAWAQSPDNPIPGGGESIRDLHRRSAAAIDVILAEEGDDARILIFTHGGVNRVLLSHLLSLDLQGCRRCQQDNTAVNTFVRRHGLFFLRRWNDVSHLVSDGAHTITQQ